MKTVEQKPIKFTEHKKKREIHSLYTQHDRLELNLSEPGPYSEMGKSILDDISYFLTHPELRERFEHAQIEFLKDFAMACLKSREDH